MLRVSYGCNWNPHYNFLHSVLAELNVTGTVTIQRDADKLNIHTPGEERIFSSSITMSDGEAGHTKKNRICRLESKNSERYHAKYKERKVAELWITMVWAGAGRAPQGVLFKRSYAIHFHDITARWSGMTRQTEHCTNSTCRTQNTVPVQHGFLQFSWH
jgi:hypothetical protein